MKKRIMFIFILFSCLFVNVYASSLKDESAIVRVGNVDAPVYNVEISWGKMEFIYTERINYVWNDDEHVYDLGQSNYNWVSKDNFVDVNNKSSFEIDVELEYVSVNKNVNGNFDVSKKKLNSNTNSRFTLTLNGNLDSSNLNSVKVGAINLKIS